MSEILHQLGLNSTLLLQATLFVLTVTFMRYSVFPAFMAANSERLRRTVGGDEAVGELHQELTVLETEYQVKTKGLHESVNQIFSKHKALASAEADRLIQESRAQAQASTEQLKKAIREEMDRAKQQVPLEVKNLSTLMVQKLLEKGG